MMPNANIVVVQNPDNSVEVATDEQVHTVPVNVNDDLNLAAIAFDVERCREMLGSGADPKHVFREGGNGWYEGDSSTALYNAIEIFKGLKAEDQAEAEGRYVDVVVLLLEAGADADFAAERGNWNRSTSYPLMDAATQTICCLHDATLKRRLLAAIQQTRL